MKLKRRAGFLVMMIVLVSAALISRLWFDRPPSRFMIKFLNTAGSTTAEIPLEEYLVGVVLNEMPASFESEALKAQAVCARTFTLAKYFSDKKHPGGADVCDDIRCCQGFTSPEEYLRRYPHGEWAVEKIRNAVTATAGQVITCRGQLVEPVYHSTCGGHTESSQTVWGYDHCYLQGVPCPWDSASPYQHQVLTMSIEQFRQALKLNSNSSVIPQRVKSTENGTVAEIAWGKVSMTGQQVRQALQLPSARFTIAVSGDAVAVKTTGNGHGVGLCQYGANGMAAKGKSYLEILHYYYQEITLYKVAY